MHCSVTLNQKEFSTIHNGLCDLSHACERLYDVLAPELYQLLLNARDQVRSGLDSAYEQDNKAFTRKSCHYDEVKAELGLKNSKWSIYEVDNLSDRHPFEGADRVVYRDHWGRKPVSSSINGLSWVALWRAADACIRDSGDRHHEFIESFNRDPEDTRTLILSTGS